MKQKIIVEHPIQNTAFDEPYISLAEACNMFPNGHVSRASLERWWRTGVRGAVLQTYLIGHRRYTTLSAIKKFIEEQQVEQGEFQVFPNSQREKHISSAEARVRELLK